MPVRCHRNRTQKAHAYEGFEGFYSRLQARTGLCNFSLQISADFSKPGMIRLHDVKIQNKSKFTPLRIELGIPN